MVTVVSVEMLESLDGYASDSSVVSQSKRFRLLGSHPEMVQSVIFTSSTCDNVFKMFSVSQGGFEGFFDHHSNGLPLSLCVKYPQESPIDTGIVMTLKALEGVETNSGDERVLIWGTTKTFIIKGYGLNPDEDTVEFVLATSVPNQNEQ